MTRFELVTSRPPGARATKLRYTPTQGYNVMELTLWINIVKDIGWECNELICLLEYLLINSLLYRCAYLVFGVLSLLNLLMYCTPSISRGKFELSEIKVSKCIE